MLLKFLMKTAMILSLIVMTILFCTIISAPLLIAVWTHKYYILLIYFVYLYIGYKIDNHGIKR